MQCANASMCLYATAPAFLKDDTHRCREAEKVTEKLWGMRPVTLHCNVIGLTYRNLPGLSHFLCAVIHSEHPANDKWDLRKCC